MSLPLLTTKLYTPRPRTNAISRPRLVEKLRQGINAQGSLVLVSGPAGFGKTTLLSSCVQELALPVSWLSLDEADNDPVRFWAYFITACQALQPGIGDTALTLLRSPQPLPEAAIPSMLVNEMAGIEKDFVLVLDDLHTVQAPAVYAGLAFLSDHNPGKLHLVLSTRSDPPLPLARYRARNQLVEIRAADLRFNTQEAAAFLNQVMGLQLSPEHVAALEARTEGWIAGLQLAALSMSGRDDVAAFIQAFTGSHIYVAEYLVQEVLQRQPADTQAFLLQTSILERLTAELCEAVTGQPGAQAVLSSLHRENLFLIPLDDSGQWFRFHALFSDLLQARLRQSSPAQAVAELHLRAAHWFEQAGMPEVAVDHAQAAGDNAFMVHILERVALPLILQAHVRTVERWLEAVPAQLVEGSPRLNMAFAWMHLLRGLLAQADPYLERLACLFADEDPTSQDASLHGEWLALQSKLMNMQGKPAESRDLANLALKTLPEQEFAVRSMLLVNLATAYQQMLDYHHAAEVFQQIARQAHAAGDHISETLGLSGQAQMLLQQGCLREVYAVASEGLRRLEHSHKSTPFSATLYGELGQVHYYWCQLDDARRYSLLSIQTSGQSGYSDPEIYHHLTLAHIHQMEGDWQACGEETSIAVDLAQRTPPAMVREEIIAQKVRVHLAFEQIAQAQAALQADGFLFEQGLAVPELPLEASVTHPLGLLYNSALRILLHKALFRRSLEDLPLGLALADRVLDGELRCRHIPIALQTLLIRSQLHAALGDTKSASADIDTALDLAEPEAFISPFIEEGPPVAAALEAQRRRRTLSPARLAYLHKLLEAFPAAAAARQTEGRLSGVPEVETEAGEGEDIIEPLTARELEVLQWIAAGDSNQTIANKLVITVSAVKKHTSNILGKLNVSNRTQATARARRLGLVH